jgi:hypothetical protein
MLVIFGDFMMWMILAAAVRRFLRWYRYERPNAKGYPDLFDRTRPWV